MPNELRLSAYSAATRADLSAGRVVINADTQHDPRTAPLYATIYAPQQARAVVNVPLFYEGAWRGLLTVFTTEPRQWQAHEIQLLETVAERVWLAVEKLRLDLALRRSEEQLRLITEHMPGLIGLFNEREEYLFMNRYYHEKLGLNREQSIGQSVRTLFGETAYAVAQPSLRRALAGESVTFENRLMTTSGVSVDLVVTLVPYWVDKRVQGCYVMAIDITERKRQERQLQELNATLDQRVTERTEQLEQKNVELERSNKELDKFAYIASHDLRAPLRAIDNLSSWIAEDAGHVLPEPSKEHLAKLRGRVRRMEKLLEDLLAYSRIGRFSYNCERLVIKQVLQESLALLNLPPTFHVTLVEPLPVIWAQRVPLELVLRNLIGNAIKHHHRSDGHVQIAAHEKERWVEFVISDDGPGIDPRFHDKIFEIFQTLQPRDTVEGSGVGLALVKKAIDIVGGTIAVESTTGVGATFRFTWPKLVRAA
jgi:PAS domain S-box-containing protein